MREFPKLSSRMIAELCGVSNHMVDRERGELGQNPSSTRMGADGKERPATRRTSVTFAPPEPEDEAEEPDEDEVEADGVPGAVDLCSNLCTNLSG